MKIYALLHGFGHRHVAGAEKYAHDMFRWFASRGHEILVITPQTMFEEGVQKADFEGIPMVSMDSVNLKETLREADICVTHLDCSTLMTQICKEISRPCVHIIHNPYSLGTWKFVDGDIDLAIFNSEWIYKRKQPLNVPATVLYPPVFEKDYCLPDSGQEREFITLLNRNINKGGPFVAEIAKNMPDEKFMMVRGAYPASEQHCPNLGNVFDQGHTADPRQDVYARTRILLVPSLMETWGRVAIEALWAGIPVIANSLCTEPGLLESLGDAALWAPRSGQKQGYPNQEVAQWVTQIRSLSDPDRYQQRVELGLQRAKFLEQKTIEQLTALEQQFFSLVNHQRCSRVHVVASEIHYMRHLTPTLHQMHPDRRGLLVVPESLKIQAVREGHRVVSYDEKHPLTISRTLVRYGDPATSLGLVAGTIDQKTVEQLGYPVFRQEHGLGQTYDLPGGKKNASYAGSAQHGRLFGYAAPGTHPYTKQKQAFPKIPAYRVGLPFLDRFPEQTTKPAAVGFVFHWNNTVQPETEATWDYWMPSILKLRDVMEVRLHCHPRERDRFMRYLELENVEHLFVEDLEDLHQQVDVVCGDNTSAMFMLAAVGHPIVVLNHPKYRRHIDYGLRFWECEDIGIPCNHPSQLQGCVAQASLREEEDYRFRKSALNYLFYRLKDASLVQAMILEGLIDFRVHTRDQNPYTTVFVQTSFHSSRYGAMVKKQSYFVKREDAEQMRNKGLVSFNVPGELREYEWPTLPQSNNGGMMRPRQPGESLLRVEEKFRDNGVEYKPGDMVLSREIRSENLEKCRKYEPKARKPEGMETK